ncbi:MAG: CBS domain-containing protein [Alphaproteobacteria bacterium]|nr:CBS domain-containing protein [Alphaproteobacteria bacterium]
MPCRDALVSSVVSLKENHSFDEALAILDKNNIRSAPVVNEDGEYLGMFSLKSTFKALLPVAITMEGGLDNVDFVIGASPGIAKKLKKIGPRHIGDHIDNGIIVGHMDTPLLEAMRLMVRQGSPLPVVDRKNGRFIGLVSEQSILTMFQHLHEIVANRPAELSPEDVALLKEFGVLE